MSAKSSYQPLSQTAKAQERIARAKRSWEKCAHSQKQKYKTEEAAWKNAFLTIGRGSLGLTVLLPVLDPRTGDYFKLYMF